MRIWLPNLNAIGIAATLALTIALPADAYAIDCGWQMRASEDERALLQRLEASIDQALGTNDGWVPSEDLPRLNALVAEETLPSVMKLEPAAREQFFRVLESPLIGYTGIKESSATNAKTLGLGDVGAAIRADGELGLHLVMDYFASQHRMGRAYLRHELSHLSRFVSGEVVPQDEMDFMNSVLERQLGVYREEVAAYRDEYRYLRRAHDRTDLMDLKRGITPLTAKELDHLVALGLVDGKTKTIKDKTPALNDEELKPEVLESFGRFIRAALDRAYIANLEMALNLSEPEYIKAMIGPEYRDFQRQQHSSADKSWWEITKSTIAKGPLSGALKRFF